MTAKHLDSYCGKLSAAQVAAGMNAARRNAHRLAEDAKILFDEGRYPTAASLAILSIEEAGKQSILRQLALVTGDKQLKTAWKDYRSHIKKNAMWLLPQLAAEGARHLDDFRELFEEDAEHTFLLDKLKQVSFYTDCLGKAHWPEPSEVIDKDLAKLLLDIAQIFTKDSDVTTKEIELWVKHLGTVMDKPLVEQKKALLNWYAELQELGITDKTYKIPDLLIWLGFTRDERV